MGILEKIDCCWEQSVGVRVSSAAVWTVCHVSVIMNVGSGSEETGAVLLVDTDQVISSCCVSLSVIMGGHNGYYMVVFDGTLNNAHWKTDFLFLGACDVLKLIVGRVRESVKEGACYHLEAVRSSSLTRHGQDSTATGCCWTTVDLRARVVFSVVFCPCSSQSCFLVSPATTHSLTPITAKICQ